MTTAVVATVIVVGAIAAVARYLVSRVFAESRFPWAVLIVNVVASAIGGTVLGLADAGDVSADVRLIILTGLCGGLSTFSTFSVETVQLLLDGKTAVAVRSVVANVVLGAGTAAVAYAAVRLVVGA